MMKGFEQIILCNVFDIVLILRQNIGFERSAISIQPQMVKHHRQLSHFVSVFACFA